MTQQKIIIKYLQEHPEGLNSYDATYKVLYPELYPHKIKQAPTRVSEVNDLGYHTISKNNPNGSVNWILQDSPITKADDPYEWDISTGFGRRILKSEINKPEQLNL